MAKQRTIAKPVSFSGRGLHSGNDSTVTFKPAPAGGLAVLCTQHLPYSFGFAIHHLIMIYFPGIMVETYRQLKEYLGAPLAEWTVDFRVHATQRMFSRNIQDKDVGRLLDSGQVIEEYREDFPLPSILVSGLSTDKSPLHAVIGVDLSLMQLHIITVYKPDPKKRSKDHTRRITT